MNYDEQMQQVINQAKKDVNEIAKNAHENLQEMRCLHEEEVAALVKEFRHTAKETLNEAEESLERTKKKVLAGAGGVFALILLGFIMFLYYEAKDINKSILDLHSQIQYSKSFLEQEVANFKNRTAELSEQIDTVMEENQSAINSLSFTSNQYESRLTEMSEVTQRLDTKLTSLESLSTDPNIMLWREAWDESAEMSIPETIKIPNNDDETSEAQQ